MGDLLGSGAGAGAAAGTCGAVTASAWSGVPGTTPDGTATAQPRATLLALAQDRAIRDGWAEVVLVDDRSTDETVAEVMAAGLPRLRVLHAAPDPASRLTTRQQALDLGFRAAAAPVIPVKPA